MNPTSLTADQKESLHHLLVHLLSQCRYKFMNATTQAQKQMYHAHWVGAWNLAVEEWAGRHHYDMSIFCPFLPPPALDG